MAQDTSGRVSALKKTGLLLTLFPLTVIYAALFLVLGIVAAIANNLVLLVRGTPLFSENNPFGFLIYWSSSNAQAVMFGRGDYDWIPPVSVLWS